MREIILKAAPPTVLNRKPSAVQLADDSLTPVKGWACKYNVDVIRWFGLMTIRPGAFTDSLDPPSDIRVLSQHDSWAPIGLAESFKDSAEGLYINAKVTNATQAGAEMIALVNAGIVVAFSVGFDIIDSEVEKVTKDEQTIEREVITKARLRECSLVTFPALEDAKVEQSEPREGIRTDYSAAQDAINRILVSDF